MKRALTRIATIIALSLPLVCQARILQAPSTSRVLEEINLARSQPHRYATYLRQLRGQTRGRIYQIPGSDLPVVTREGSAAIDEAIRFLERQKPLPPLAWSPGLAAAARELAREQSASGSVGHRGESGDMRQRIERQGSWDGHIGENIAYGPGDPRGMVMQLIINDGEPGRGHRRNLFRRSFAMAGISCTPHPGYGSVCVMDFAGRFLE